MSNSFNRRTCLSFVTNSNFSHLNPQEILDFEIENVYYPQPDIQTSPPRTPDNMFTVDSHIPSNVQVHQVR